MCHIVATFLLTSCRVHCSYLTQGINGMKKDVDTGRRIRMYVIGQVYHVMIPVKSSVYHFQRMPNDRFYLVLSGLNKEAF